jgi:hypothetical protein
VDLLLTDLTQQQQQQQEAGSWGSLQPPLNCLTLQVQQY